MSDEEQSIPDTYRPRSTRTIEWEAEAPHGETRTLTATIKAGTEYEIVPEEEADEVLGNAPISNLNNLIRESCYTKARS